MIFFLKICMALLYPASLLVLEKLPACTIIIYPALLLDTLEHPSYSIPYTPLPFQFNTEINGHIHLDSKGNEYHSEMKLYIQLNVP